MPSEAGATGAAAAVRDPATSGGGPPPPTLEQLLRPVAPVELDARAGEGSAWEWLHAGSWRIPVRPSAEAAPGGTTVELFRCDSGRVVRATQLQDGSVFVPFDPDEAYRNYVTEAWRANVDLRALSTTQLRVYYRIKRLLPRELRLILRRAFARLVKPPPFPAWPLELGVDRLLRFTAGCQLRAAGADQAPFLWFWPGDARAAAILTHDVESAEGLRLSLDLADLEQERGLRSSFNVVAADYDIDHGILRELRDRGFEIGLHGLHHDRSLFSSRAEFERQLPRLVEAVRDLGAEGFRSPATHRVIDWLSELPVAYDCTVPHSDPYEPQPGGCASLWPFMLGQVLELPYTLPQDHTLFTVLRKRSVEPWLEQVCEIERHFGMIQCLSHPGRGYLGDADKRAIYAELLDALAERPRLWKALPRDVARWWRMRETRADTDSEQLLGTMHVEDSPDYARFVPPRCEPAPARP